MLIREENESSKTKFNLGNGFILSSMLLSVPDSNSKEDEGLDCIFFLFLVLFYFMGLASWPKLPLNAWSSCHSLLSVGLYHYARKPLGLLTPRQMQVRTLPVLSHSSVTLGKPLTPPTLPPSSSPHSHLSECL